MNGISKWVAVLLLSVGAMAANAWTVTYATVTYAFTGVVTSSDFSTLPIGAYVTGTYTFNYNSADQIIGFHGSAIGGPPDVIYFGAGIGGWAIGSTGVPYNPVFSSTVRIGASVAYSSKLSAPPIDPDDSSIVTGNGSSTLSATEATPAFDTGSFFTVVEVGHVISAPYTSTGLPVTLTASQSGYGGYSIANGQLLRYQITSLTLAPAPPPATLLATLLTSVTGAGLGDRLADKVERAQIDYGASNIQATCHVLAEFLQEVQRKDEKTIAPSLDVTLTRQAQAIAATIGCT
jgi:hypothetical protein